MKHKISGSHLISIPGAMNGVMIVALALSLLLTFVPCSSAQTDVTDQTDLVESSTRYDRRTGMFSFDVSLKNISDNPLAAPIKVVIVSISSPDVTVANPDGTDQDMPYFLYEDEIAGGQLDSGEMSTSKRWVFNNPTRVRFTYEAQVWAGPTLEVDNDVDGIPDVVEDGAPNGGDGNNDGIPDSQQENVTSLPNSADGRYVTLVSPPGTNLAQVVAGPNPSPGNTPADADFPVGFFSFQVQGLTVGTSAIVTLFLPPDVGLSTYYRYGPTPDDSTPHWYEFLFDGTTGAEMLLDRVVFHFVDGLVGDDDLTANSEVADPGGPAAGPCALQYGLAPGQCFRCELSTYGTGDTPVWESPSILPPGLQLIQDGVTGRWYVDGTVAQNVPLVPYSVDLSLTSAGSLLESRQMTFNVGVPFSVFTQNTLLRPEDAVPGWVYAAVCPLAPTLCGLAILVEGIYDSQVQNEDDDNEQRTNLILSLTSGRDLVALQEVFDDDRVEQIVDDANGYIVFPGPPRLTPPDGIELSSGLALLIRMNLCSTSQLLHSAMQHKAQVFEDCNRTTDDCFAQKGFTLDLIHLSPDPDHWIYVVNTHTQATKAEDALIDELVRTSQLGQMKEFIDANTDERHPVLIMGDFNVVEHELEYHSMLGILDLDLEDDLFREYGPGSVDQRYTFDPARNAYASNWFPDDPPGRLDYILARQGTVYKLDVDSIGMSDLPFFTSLCHDEGWPLSQCHVSDHFGLWAALRLSKKEPELVITSPEDGSTHLEGETVRLHVRPVGRPELYPDFIWTSDIEGNIGTTNYYEWTVESTGTHTITASVIDFDGLSYSASVTIIALPDSDRDGLSDEDELIEGTNPNEPDTDGDGLLDGEEVHVYNSDPLNPDTDGDGVSDGVEVSFGASPLLKDTDQDGLPDGYEIPGIDPAKVDTDDDGVWDGVEVILGTDPTSATSTPTVVPEGTLFAASGGGFLSIIDPASGLIGNVGQPGFGLGFGLAAYSACKLFISQTSGLAIADPLTADATEIGPFETPSGEEIDVINLAFDRTTWNLYGVEEGPAPSFLPTGQLVHIERATGTATLIGIELDDSIHALAFDPTGRLFAAVEGSTSDLLVEMNPATGEIIQPTIGEIGFTPVFGLVFDQSGVLFGTALDPSALETQLLTIDPTTGVGTPIILLDQGVFDLTITPRPVPSLNPAPGSPLSVPDVWDVAAGDLNGDAFPDLVAIGSIPGTFSQEARVLLGDGMGGFIPASSISLPPIQIGDSSGDSVEIGDLNGDLIPDIIIGDCSDGVVRVFHGNDDGTGKGDGTFTSDPNSPYPVGGYKNTLNDVAIADVNSDTFPDIMATFFSILNEGRIAVLFGDGAGGFTPGMGFHTGTAGPTNLAVGDVDGDGFLDIANGVFYGSVVVRVSGVGQFLLEDPDYLFGPFTVAMGDFNGDSFDDVAIADLEGGQVGVALWDNTASDFGPISRFALTRDPDAYPVPSTIDVGDLTGDGVLDIATGNADWFTGCHIAVLEGDGVGGFTLACTSPYPTIGELTAVELADINLDGLLDVLVSNYSPSGIEVFLNE